MQRQVGPTVINPFPLSLAEQVQIPHNLMNFMPPLRARRSEVPYLVNQMPPAQPADDRSEIKERNRIAAQKWRQKKDHYLGELEEANDQLRKQALELSSQIQSLKVENKVLESELLFFQQFMSKVMSAPK